MAQGIHHLAHAQGIHHLAQGIHHLRGAQAVALPSPSPSPPSWGGAFAGMVDQERWAALRSLSGHGYVKSLVLTWTDTGWQVWPEHRLSHADHSNVQGFSECGYAADLCLDGQKLAGLAEAQTQRCQSINMQGFSECGYMTDLSLHGQELTADRSGRCKDSMMPAKPPSNQTQTHETLRYNDQQRNGPITR